MTDHAEGAEGTVSPAMAISNHMVRLLAAYVGCGLTNARTTLETNIALVTLGQTMSRGGHNLVAAGEADAVRATRQIFRCSMRDQAVAGWKRSLAAGWSRSFADIDTDAGIAVVVFVFAPQPESDGVNTTDAEYAPGSEPVSALSCQAGADHRTRYPGDVASEPAPSHARTPEALCPGG